tara:strand:+ start:780 stop:1208 length:429 start_codon:yes stop_codon:yes gene_type:complete
MGFDLSGLNPIIKSEPPDIDEDFDGYMKWHNDNPGVYFRNNIWSWRPLWSFVCKECDDILTARDAEMGSYNDGHKISKTKSLRIAKRLKKLLNDGEVDLHKAGYDAHVEAVNDEWAKSYPFTIENVVNFAEFCEQSGGFEIY